MVQKITLATFLLFTFIFLNLENAFAQSFSQSDLNPNGFGSFNGVTALMYGPDGRLYVAEYPGSIKVLTIQRNSATDYDVIAMETLDDIQNIENHDDDGTDYTSAERQVTGLTVVGTASNPIIYVTSSDFRHGGGFSGGSGDIDLDTNSGVITRLTWSGTSWDVVDLVRGLPRSEENHSINGLEFTTINGSDYLIVAQGGHTNGGAPSDNFVFQCEYALSGAVLSVDLSALNSLPVLNDNGRSYIYDLPTLDDPTRANANSIVDPNAAGYNGVDVNDPFGGNDGLNQAIVVPGGPVQIFSPGYRNPYDLTVTQSGALYVTDNGGNVGWGGFPMNEGGGSATNDYDPTEPGSQSPSGGEQINNEDHLQLVTTNLQTYTPGSYYGGHPNPTRANPSGAGLYTSPALVGNAGAVFRTQTYDPDGSVLGSTTNAAIALPANWPPASTANAVEGDWRGPGLPNPDGPVDGEVTTWNTNTNGIDEYTATNFGGAMQGNLLATSNSQNVRRVELNASGALQNLDQTFLSGLGGWVLGITCNSDTDNFPGTIWAGTYSTTTGKIVVFEPQDFNCIDPGQPGYDQNADYDNDGYTNLDEELSGTDACNGGSQPNDYDKIAGGTLISDLNDTDDDADGIPDAMDPFQLGNPSTGGSDAFTIPINNEFFNEQQGLGGIFGLGLTGLMNNGNTGPNWLDWLDVEGGGPNPDDVLGGAIGLMTSHMTSGTALGAANTQDKAYQYGVQTNTGTGTFTVSGNLVNLTGPLRLYGNTAAIGGELGHYIGDGTQSNYIMIVLTTSGITALQEINDVPQTPINVSIPELNRPTSGIVFYFVVDPSNGQVDLEYEIDGGGRINIGTVSAQGSILDAIQQSNQDLAVGLIGTSNTNGVELEGSWDFLNVTLENIPNVELAINAGGPLANQDGTSFTVDQNFVNGAPYTNPSALVPELYKTERSSPTKTFQYSIPLSNGDYNVVLHFAEIYWGATGGGLGGNNLRVFDVSIEDNLVLDNYDIYSEVGAEVVQKKSFDVTINDGFLTIDFSSLAAVGGINQPKVSAIEILSNSSEFPPIDVVSIVEQNNEVGDVINLGVSASGGNPNSNFSYFISGQPDGVNIEPTNGLISGTINELAATGGANGDGVFSVIIRVEKPGSNPAIQSFDWRIGNLATSCSWNDLADATEGRFETLSQLVGDKLYVMGGWLPGNPSLVITGQNEIYDTTNDTWSFGASIPTPVTHTGHTVVGDEIWLIAGFTGNDPGIATNVVQVYNTTTDTWRAGPQLPNATGSGAAAFSGNKIHYFGGLLPDRQTDVGNHYVLDLANESAGWSEVSPLPNPRNHLAGTSVDGIIYAIGGQFGHRLSVVNTKLLHSYNPTTDQWTRLADLPTERSHFEPGTTVHNGKIIIVGGRTLTEFFDLVTQYDPQQDLWTELCNLPEKLLAPAAKVIDDKLIVVGGGVDGVANLSNSTRWLQLDPINNPQTTWIDKNENENYTARHENSFVQAGDKFYLMGGRESARNIDVYDYSSDTWTTLVDSAPFEFNHFQATEYQGLIWVIGSFQTNSFPTEAPAEYVWAFDPANEEWIQGGIIPQGRRRGSAGLVIRNDKFYIVGGNTAGHDGGFVPWFDEYDPATGIWTPLVDAPLARDHFGATVIGDDLYLAGGRLSGGAGGVFAPTIPEVDVYNFGSGNWSTLPTAQNIPTTRGGASTANLNGKLVVIGGEVENEVVYGVNISDALKITEEYDPNTQTWTRLADLNSERHGTQAIVSGDGIFILAGSTILGGGGTSSQKNMEVFGLDNPIGNGSIASTLSAPSSVLVTEGAGTDINLDVIDGNQGIIINSIEFTGVNAQDFSSAASGTQSRLIGAGASLTINVQLSNQGPNKSATLVINYGANSEINIPLQSVGVTQDLAFSQERGFYDIPFDLGLFSGISGATIRYTLDGSTPTQTNGIIYGGNPLAINTTTTVRAIAYSGASESSLETHSYIFLDDVVQQPANIAGWPNNVYNLGTGGAQATHDYEMDPAVVNAPAYSSEIKPGLTSIPTMSIVMNKDDFWTVYDGEVGIDGSVEVIYPDDEYPSEHFIAEVESHSHLRLKRSLKLDINNSVTSNLLKTGPLTGNSATTNFTDTKFVLRGGNNRAWSRNWNADRTAFTRDEWYRASQVAASGIGMRGAFVHLYVNGLYWGLYNPVQRQDAGFMAAYFGGVNDDYMTLNHGGVKSGDPTRFNYLTNTLINQDMSVQTNYEEAKEYIDVEKFIDYLMVTWSMGMTDWPTNNFYGGNRNNPAEPFNYYAWDGEWSWDTTLGSNNGAWVHPLFRSGVTSTEPISKLWHSLRANPEFVQLFVDRVNLQFFNGGPLSDNASRTRWATVNQYIETAVIAESARWGDGLNDGQTRTKNDDWQPEVDRLDGLMNGNAERFVDALRAEGYYPALDAVVFNKQGGSVISSFELEMTNPNPSGTIYYTTDGSDPQLPNGSVSPSAIAYTVPLDVPETGILEIITRVNNGSDWSASNEASFAEMELYINEFLASNATGITDESGALEDWIEFYNAGVLPVDIGGMYITDNLLDLTQWQIPDTASEQTTIPAGDFLYVWADNDSADGPLHVDIKLGSGGEAIGLSIDGPTGVETIDSYVFGPQTADISTGRFADGEDNFVTFDNPTPGAPNEIGFLSGIYINEFIAGNATGITDEAGDLDDWIEIYNSNSVPVDIGGLYITDDLANPLLFQIPADNPTATTIPAGGFIILWADDEPLEGPLHVGLKLGKGGEDIGLTQVIGIEQQFIDSLTFGPQSDDVSTGREPDGGSTIRFYFEPTPGSSNIVPFVAGLSINEALAVNTNSISDSNGENDPWIEIYNLNATPIDIGGLYVSNDSGNPSLWQIPNTNPAVTTIPVGGFITLWADNQTAQGELHLPFSLSSGGGTIVISDIIGADISNIDTMTYTGQSSDVSFGRYPDASAQFKLFGTPTPNNNNILPLVTNIFINEYMASNAVTISDEAGEFDDWIELYNAGTTAVDVGGLFIVDDLAEADPYQIPTTSPSETTIAPGGFLLLWADKQEAQGVLHVGIKLSGGGEQIGLLQINGNDSNFIDSLTYTAQTEDISEGRSFDGAPTFVSFETPTPNASNGNLPSGVVTSFTLINAVTNQDISTLTDGAQFSIQELPTTSLNIRANALDVGSVQFLLSGALTTSNTESVAPYALYGDNAGNYNEQLFIVGNYTLTATPFSGAGLTGIQGPDFTVSFEIIEDSLPIAICQDITVSLDNNGTVSITGADVDNGSNALDGIASLSVFPNSFDCNDLGANTILLTVTDTNNNISTCSATVTVEDNTPPVISCPANLSVPSSNGSPVIVSLIDATAIDNCTTVSSITGVRSDAVALSDPYPVGTTMIEWTATDDEGNSSTCIQNVEITFTAAAGNDITSFSLPSQISPASINITAKTVDITVIFGTDVTALAPSIGVSADAVIDPASGTSRNFTNPVTYSVTSADDDTQQWSVTVTVAPETLDSIWLEAECAIVGGDWSLINDGSTSNGQYVLTPLGDNIAGPPTDTDQMMTFEFQVDAGTYGVHALVQSATGADDSFWVRPNGGTWIRWNKITNSPVFVWDRVEDSDNGQQPVNFNFVSGTNTLDFALREDGASLDKIYITSTGNLPTGLGGTSSNCVIVSEPPTADAGTDQNIMLPTDSVVLTGSGNDPDGGAIVSYAWTQEPGGPSTATLSGSSTTQLIANNLEEGTYVFRLTVTDDEGDTAFDEVSVSVTPDLICPTTLVVLSTQQQVDDFATTYDVANCTFEGGILIEGTDITNLDGLSTLTNIDGFLSIVNTALNNLDGLSSLTDLFQSLLIEGNSVLTNIDGLSSINPIYISISGTYVFRLTVTDDEGATGFDEVTVTITPETSDNGLSSLVAISDSFIIMNNASLSNLDGLLSLGFLDNDLIIESNPMLENLDGLSSLDAVGLTLSIQSNASLTNLDGLSSVTNMFSDLNIIDNDNLTNLDGLFNDDTDNGQQPVNFNFVSGTNTLDFALREDGASLDKIYITSTGNLPTGLGGTSSNCIIVSEPPTADAGTDQNIMLPTDSVVLTGSGNDPDGGAIVSYAWTQEPGGPSTATLIGEATTELTASNLVEGTYVFRLTVTDDEDDTGFDEVIVTAAGIVLLPPTADAGTDQNIMLPTDSVVLAGSGNDPDGGAIVSYAWTQEPGGPSTATLIGEATTELTASNLVEGTYVFRLTVTDDEGATGFDEVTVTITPETSDTIWLEAECAIVGGDWSLIDDGSASNGQYVMTPLGHNISAPPTDTDQIVRFEFQANAGVYSVHALVQAGTLADDSFWVRANDGNWIRWNKIISSPVFVWDRVEDSDNAQQPVNFNFDSGTNTLDFALREDGVALDKLYVTNTASLPTGLGGTDLSCSAGAGQSGKSANQAILSPNPASTSTTLSFEKSVEIIGIQVFDLMGRLIHSYNGIDVVVDESYVLDIQTIPAGTYFIRSYDSNGNSYQKQIVIKK